MAEDWFATIKAQHQELDRLLAAVKSAGSHPVRVAASKQLYGEQDEAKVLVARIGDAISMNQDAEVPAMLDKLATALHAHVAEEENQDFPGLKAKEDAKMKAKLTADYHSAFQRAS